MKRSVCQAFPSQEESSKMSRHNLAAVEETPTKNVFLIETVLRRLFKQIESVSMLKDLRKMCQLWDRLDTEELEERAFQGLIKPINLTFFNEVSREFRPIKDSRLELREFLVDTSENPRLFRSFTIIFPCSLALLNLYKFRSFYKDYSPTFLELANPKPYSFQYQDKERLLQELLRWAAPTLREIVIRDIFAQEHDLIPSRKSLPVQSFNFPHLRKVGLYGGIYETNHTAKAFKVIFTKEYHPETPSLTALKLRCEDPYDLLDLNSNPSRWANLTMLEIRCNNNYPRLSQLTNELLSLAQAGMILKKLDLGLTNNWENNFLGFQHLNQFFASQAGSLEALRLSLNLRLNVTIEEDQDEERQLKIILPVFERLHTLSLNLNTSVYTNGIFTSRNIFEFGPIPQYFPALENLTILNFGDSINEFFGGSCEEEERMNLKRIAIPKGIWECVLDLGKSFRSVEAFSCLHSAFENLGILRDLIDTIRVLHIRDVYSELDLSQFKGLKRVVIEEDDKANRTKRMRRKLEENIERYLGYFKKVAELGLDSIMFRGLAVVGEEYREIAQAFPFRVEFEEKPVDWFGEDFISY